MEARKIKAILEEASIQQSIGGFCAISASGLFHQAQEIIMDAYKNSAYFGSFIQEIGMQEVFELGFVDKALIEKIKAYTSINNLWCLHAREFLNLSEEDVRSFLLSRGFALDSKGLSGTDIKEDSNIVLLRSHDNEDEIDYQDVKRFLKISGFKVSKSDVISESDIKLIIMQTKSFIEDAYENAEMARNIAIEVLNQNPEILATMRSELLDDLSKFAAKNDAWMISMKKSFFTQDDNYLPGTISIEEGNVVDLLSRTKKDRHPRVREGIELEILRL